MDVSRIAKGFRSDGHRRLFLAAVRAGWTWRVAGSGHILMQSPDGQERVTLSQTAYDGPGGTGSIRAAMRRAGVDL